PGANSFAGDITLGSASRINSDAGTLTLSGAVGGAGLNLTVGGAGNTTLSGIIGTTTGSLTKDGAGTLTLSGANTYSGGTTVSAGILSGTTASLQGDIANNANLTFNQATTGSYAGVISATGSLTIAGSG